MSKEMATFMRRNRPGTSAKNFSCWAEQSFGEMDGVLALQQFIQQLIRKDPANVEQILNMPDTEDEGSWKYEHLRQFCLELNGLVVGLQKECIPAKCKKMTATDNWIFLCAAHRTPRECAAVDYARHTLDGATSLLNSSKNFPSRVLISEASVDKLGSVCRRLYRIFSHAYFHHRELFEDFENKTHLCNRFSHFVTKYNLMSKDHMMVPTDDKTATFQVGESNV